jgi:hypothetical protein
VRGHRRDRAIRLANELCDLVQVRSGQDGTTIRIHTRRSAKPTGDARTRRRYTGDVPARRLLRSRKRAVTPPPWQVERADVEAISTDPELRERIHRAFKITLDLDARFAVIVNLTALHAHKHGPKNPLTEAELYDGCRQTWPAGFQSTQLAGFRELLNELEGLGILGRPDLKRGGRTLRSSAVLQSLGRRDEIELTLKEVGDRALPESDARLQY